MTKPPPPEPLTPDYRFGPPRAAQINWRLVRKWAALALAVVWGMGLEWGRHKYGGIWVIYTVALSILTTVLWRWVQRGE